MTRLVIVTDVHADHRALQDALRQAQQLGCTTVLCAGDLIDEGKYPERTLALLKERSVITIRGNHERWCLDAGVDLLGRPLTARSLAYLDSLPASWSKVIDGVKVVMFHARPGSDMDGIYKDTPEEELAEIVEETGARVYISGHTHVPLWPAACS